jgi:hypothetical protein
MNRRGDTGEQIRNPPGIVPSNELHERSLTAHLIAVSVNRQQILRAMIRPEVSLFLDVIQTQSVWSVGRFFTCHSWQIRYQATPHDFQGAIPILSEQHRLTTSEWTPSRHESQSPMVLCVEYSTCSPALSRGNDPELGDYSPVIIAVAVRRISARAHDKQITRSAALGSIRRNSLPQSSHTRVSIFMSSPVHIMRGHICHCRRYETDADPNQHHATYRKHNHQYNHLVTSRAYHPRHGTVNYWPTLSMIASTHCTNDTGSGIPSKGRITPETCYHSTG